MKVKRFEEVSMAVVVFDDNMRWVRVDRQKDGEPARTVVQTRAKEALTKEELCQASDGLWALVEVLIHQTLKEQEQLFAHNFRGDPAIR